MSKNNVIEMGGREAEGGRGAPDLPGGGGRVGGLAGRACGPADRGWQGRCGAQWPSARPQAPDRPGAGNRPDPQGPGEDRRAGDISVGAGTAVYTQDTVAGSGGALAVSEGCLQRRDG